MAPNADSVNVDADDLAFAGVVRQAELLRKGEVSSRELVELYLRRIERLDPELNAFRTVMADRALADAEQADARRRAGDDQPAPRGADRREGQRGRRRGADRLGDRRPPRAG